MTCTYDGEFRITKTEIEPCCAALHRAIIAGVVYRGDQMMKSPSRKVSCPKLRTDAKSGLVMSCCPFCGAKAHISEGCQ